MPGETPNLTRYLSPKDTTVTGGYAAALARAARSPVLRQHDPALADLLKQRAIKAWDWLEAKPGDAWLSPLRQGGCPGRG